MKKLLLLLAFFVMLPTIASAHTELTSSNPAAGQIVKEDQTQIVISYEGKIESLSTMKLLKDGQEIPFTSVGPKDNQLTGTLSNPLDNGSYTIKWSIAGEDGHPITGEIPFTVQKEAKSDQQVEIKEPVTKEPVTKKPTTNEPVTTNKDTNNQNTEQEKNNSQATGSSSVNPTIIIVVVLVVVIFGLFILFRRNRK